MYFNSLFSALAFAGLIVTMWMQREELELQREELKETKEEMKLARKESEEQTKAFKEQINLMRDTTRLEALTILVKSCDEEIYRLAKKQEFLLENALVSQPSNTYISPYDVQNYRTWLNRLKAQDVDVLSEITGFNIREEYSKVKEEKELFEGQIREINQKLNDGK